MAALQGMLPIGIVVGYSMTIALGNYWFCAFVIQAFFLMFMTVLFFFMPDRLDINFSKSSLKRNSELMFTSEVNDEDCGEQEEIEDKNRFISEINHFRTMTMIKKDDSDS